MASLITVTLSSVGTSAQVGCDYLGAKPVTAVVALTSNSSCNFNLQFTLDDLSASSVTWFNALTPPVINWSSTMSITIISSQTFASSVAVVWQFGTPIGGLRLNSTATSGTNVCTLKVLQGRGS